MTVLTFFEHLAIGMMIAMGIFVTVLHLWCSFRSGKALLFGFQFYEELMKTKYANKVIWFLAAWMLIGTHLLIGITLYPILTGQTP